MKISVLTFEKFHGREKGKIGSSIIRGDWLVNNWPEAKLWTNGQKSDVMIYQKVYWKDHMKSFKGKKILDLCDPDWMCDDFLIKEIEPYIDAITCSTDALTNIIKQYVNIPVITIPDRLDFNSFPKEVKHHEKNAEIVCWFGYVHNADQLLNMILPAVSKNKLKLHVIGNRDFIPLNYYGVNILNIVWEYTTAYNHIRNCDFVLNPNFMEKNFKFKSNNKTIISWALGNPVAISVEDVEKFIDPNERNKEVLMRQKELHELYDIKLSVNQYVKLIESL
jgi:hypothetical protein